MNTIQYIVVNKDLNMSPGKAMAQVAHAVSLASNEEDLFNYKRAKQRTVIVLEGTSDRITYLAQYLEDRNVRSDYVIDEGVNEIPPMSLTALATEQFDIEDEDKREYFRGFKLYSDTRKKWYQR